MPTYEYACTACDNHWEEVQKISEAPLEVCPKCGKSTAKRQISGGNFILKGGGWYADLYSSTPKKSGGDSAASANGSGSGAAPSADAKDTKKADTKAPAAPAAAAPATSGDKK